MVVGHSAACSLAWLAADARPGRISKVAFVGGFPSPDGKAYADFFPTQDGVMAFPGWSEFEGPDSADLDDAAKRAIASAAIPVPEGVTRGVIRLADERRYDVPVVLVCPEFTPAQAREWIDHGKVPELAKSRKVSFIDSGRLGQRARWRPYRVLSRGISRTTSAGSLSSRRPWNRGWRSSPSVVHGTSAQGAVVKMAACLITCPFSALMCMPAPRSTTPCSARLAEPA
jgi:pimeloyl-ACP methyl ester carboxylesterase